MVPGGTSGEAPDDADRREDVGPAPPTTGDPGIFELTALPAVVTDAERGLSLTVF